MRFVEQLGAPRLGAGLAALLALWAAAPAGADVLTTKDSQGGGLNWNGVIWRTNGVGNPAAPVAGNTYELVANGVAFGDNKANTRVRNPVAAGVQTFPGDSLTFNTNTDIRAKTATGLVLNFPGVGGNPGLILNGGALNAGDNAVFEFAGSIAVATPSLIAPGNNGAGAVTAGRGIKFSAALSGPGALYVIQAPTNVASMEVTSANNTNYTGEWIVKAGFLRGTGSNSLGNGDITINPAVLVPSSLVAATLTAGPALFDVMYNINSPGRLTLASGGVMYLHQACVFDSLVVNGSAVAPGLHPYSELAASFPANFATGGSGSIYVGLVAPALSLLASNQAVFLSWAALPRATNYVVKRASAPGGPYTVLGATDQTTLADGGLQNGAPYYYLIAAQSSKGAMGADSAPYEATPVLPPAAPATVAALNGDMSVTLNWSASATALSYTVKRSETGGGPYTPVTNVAGIAFRDSGLVNGAVYYYVVSAVNGAGASPDSTQVSGRPNVAPGGLAAVVSGPAVALSWNALPGAYSYNIRRATSSGGPYTLLASGVTGTARLDTGVSAGVTYYYIVLGQMDPVDPTAESPASAEASATLAPSAPGSVLAAAGADLTVTVNWAPASPGAVSYKIERALENGAFAEVAVVPASQTAYVDSATFLLTAHRYRIRAVNASGNSPYSETASATTGTFTASVNFAASTFTTNYPGFVNDYGTIFAPRAGGLSYGWDLDNTANARERSSSVSPNKLYDTFTHFQKQVPSRVWEIAVPNGTYQVRIVAGEATAKDSYHRILVEGALIVNADTRTVATAYAWAEGSGIVTVCDGRMTVKADDVAAVNAKICFITLTGVVPPALQIVSQPQSTQAIEATPVSFGVQASGAAPFAYQWHRNGAALPGQTNATLAFETLITDNGASYHVVVSTCSGQSATSDPALLSVVRDDFPPTLASASGDPTLARGYVVFSERVTAATATNLANYSAAGTSGPLALSSPLLLDDRRTVVFTTARQTPGEVYTVTVGGVTDLSPQANMIAPGSPVSFKAWVDSPFFLVAEIFTNLANGDVASLTNSAKFQNNVPDLRFYLSRFYWRSSERLPTAGLDNYGSRISGWFTPPSNGLYRFFLASDDGGQLFLNTNETDSASPAGKVLIARNDGARSYYTNNDASMSANLWLNGGQKYYIETLQKEGAGDDYVAVAFRGVPDEVAIPAMPPGIVPSVESIGGANLSTYADTLAASLNVTAAPEAALSVNENDLLTLRVRAQALPVGTPLFYVWERYDAGSGLWSPAGSSSNLSFYVPLSDDQAQYRVTLYTVGQQRRYTTTLAVATDVEPPWIESAGSLDGSTIVVKFNERVMPNVAGEGINWQVTAEDGSWPAVEPSIRVDRVVGVERISYDQVILKVTPPVTGTFQVSAFSMADWAANGNATGQSDAFGTVAGLTAQDIGTAGADPVVPGGALSFASNTVDVAAAGSDIWNAADGFQYVYRRVAGNFDIKVRVASVAAANVWSKAGLMARPLASGNSRYIAMLATPPDGQNTFTFQWRDTDGAACGSLNSAAAVAPFNTPPTYPNTWLRLTRAGSVISGFTGTNGTDWILFTNRDTALFGGAYPSSPILVGMAVTAHVNTGSNAMTLAEFRDLYFPALPVITRQPGPASLASPIHQRVDYSVAATSGADAGPLTYQWQKDGINIPGATGPALSLLNPAVTDSGSYTVVVGNNGGGAVSDAAVLMVVNELPAAVTDLIATNDCSFAFPAATLTANDTDPEGDPLAVTGVSGIEPASFAANFNDGLLPAGTALFGNAIVTASGGVSDSGCLRLTEAVTNQMGAFLINDIIPGRWLGAFTAQFMIRVGGGSAVAADGLSFNVAANLVAAAVAAAEEGVGSGLSVCLDNYDNGGGEAPALDVKVGGIVVGHVPIAKVSSTRWLQMSVELKNGGLVTVRLDGTNVFADLPTAFAPLAQARFGFYARTGGEYETHWLDDVRITVFSADTVAGGRVELVGGTVRYTNPAGGCGLDEFYYLVSDGQIDGTVSCRVAIQHPPLARNDQMSAVTAAPSVVSLSKLRANDLNQDGQALAFAFTQPAHGAVTIVDDAVTYTSLPGFTGRDSWTYSIQDSRYPASVAVVSVVVADPLPGPTVNVAASGVRNNQFWSRFAGIPGKTYRIETATDVVHGPWTLVTEASAGRNGQFEVTDTVHDPAAGQRFYRAVPR